MKKVQNYQEQNINKFDTCGQELTVTLSVYYYWMSSLIYLA